MRRITIREINLSPEEKFSTGAGLDDEGDVVHFKGYTDTMSNILRDLEDFEENPEHGRPSIWLEGWQIDED